MRAPRRRRSGFGAAALVSLAVLTGCTSDDERGPIADPPARPAVLARGVLGSQPWSLTASASGDGNLCLSVNESDVSSDPRALVGGGCGFGPPGDRDTSGVAEAVGDGTARLYFGPTPEGAVRVRLDSYGQEPDVRQDPSQAVGDGCAAATPRHVYATITHRLPRWAGDGGWFVTTVDVPEDSCGYDFGAFVAADGTTVPNHVW